MSAMCGFVASQSSRSIFASFSRTQVLFPLYTTLHREDDYDAWLVLNIWYKRGLGPRAEQQAQRAAGTRDDGPQPPIFGGLGIGKHVVRHAMRRD